MDLAAMKAAAAAAEEEEGEEERSRRGLLPAEKDNLKNAAETAGKTPLLSSSSSSAVVKKPSARPLTALMAPPRPQSVAVKSQILHSLGKALPGAPDGRIPTGALGLPPGDSAGADGAGAAAAGGLATPRKRVGFVRGTTPDGMPSRTFPNVYDAGRSSSPHPHHLPPGGPPAQAPSTFPQHIPFPTSFKMTTPMSDAELAALMEQSPLFAKMRAVKEFAYNLGVEQEVEDEEDEEEETTTTAVVPVDVETLTPRQFVVYRFGCIIVDLISKWRGFNYI